jgi:hypothetical protein
VLANLRTKLEKQVAELVEINETFVKKNTAKHRFPAHPPYM